MRTCCRDAFPSGTAGQRYAFPGTCPEKTRAFFQRVATILRQNLSNRKRLKDAREALLKQSRDHAGKSHAPTVAAYAFFSLGKSICSPWCLEKKNNTIVYMLC